MKSLGMLALLCAVIAMPVSAQQEAANAGAKAATPKAKKSGDSGIRVQIQADQEAPQVLFVLPWKELNPELDQVQFGPDKKIDWEPLKRENFLEALKIHKKIKPEQ